MGCPHIHKPLGLWILPDLMDNPNGLPTSPWTTLRVAHKTHSCATSFSSIFKTLTIAACLYPSSVLIPNPNQRSPRQDNRIGNKSCHFLFPMVLSQFRLWHMLPN